MKKALCCALLVCAAMAAAQDRATVQPLPNTIYVGAEGRFEAPPDTARVQFNIAAQEESSKAAYDRAARAAQQIRDLLRANGVDPKSAEIGFFSLQPVYDYRSPKRRLVGYRVNSSVTVKVRDLAKVPGVVQQLADIDVTENQSLHYTLDDMDAAKNKAVQDAFERARNEAAVVARAGGRQLGELLHATVDTGDSIRPPIPMMEGGIRTMAATAPPAPTAEFSPQTITVTARVNALFGMK